MVVALSSKDERQSLCLSRWIGQNGVGSIVAATGFGKTRVAMLAIRHVQKKTPSIRILVVVPTTALRDQWVSELSSFGVSMEHVSVQVINSVIRSRHTCDFLILDEAHRYPAESFSAVFACVQYTLLLCLTATFERVDGKHVLLSKYAPVCDTIPLAECLAQGWIAPYKEYLVLVEPDDIHVYKELSKEFMEHFEFFGNDFGLVMSMTGGNGWKRRNDYAKELCRGDKTLIPSLIRQITLHSTALMRALQKRKRYIYGHTKKLQVAELILSHRKNRKVITFSASTKDAERFKDGFVYTGKTSKKEGRISLEAFASFSSGVIHTVKLAEEGFDIPDISVGIMMGVNSSKTKHTQTRGRVVRYHEGKKAEFFTLVMKNTVEVDWYMRASRGEKVTIIDEKNLLKVLRNEPFKEYTEPLGRHVFRY